MSRTPHITAMSSLLKTTTALASAKSPAQVHILSLYRQMLRCAKGKDPSITSAVKGTLNLPPTVSVHSRV